MSEEKFSQFAIGAAIVDSDKTVGIQQSDGDNAQWNFQQVKTYVLNGQVVQMWDGSVTPVDVTAGPGIDITGGTISFTGDISVDMQDTYDNSVLGGDAVINLTDGSPYHIDSTSEVSRPFPSMTIAQSGILVNPLNGGHFWGADDDRLYANRGTPGVPNNEGYAYLSDIPVIVNDGAYGEMYFQGNSTETVIVTQGVPVKIAGTYLDGELSEFTHLNGTLTYTGVATKTFKISYIISTSADLNAVDVSALISVNGIISGKASPTQYLGPVTPAWNTIAVQAIITLNENDTLEAFIQNDTNTDNITVLSLNFSPISIGGTSNVINDQVVISWDGTTIPVNVTASTYMDITAGVISTTAEPNVVNLWDGSAAPVSVTSGTGISIVGGVISATGDQSVSLQDAYSNGNAIKVSDGDTNPLLLEGNGLNNLSDKAHFRIHDPSLTLNSGDITGRFTFSATDNGANDVDLTRMLPKIENVSPVTPRGSLTYQLWENAWVDYFQLNGQLSTIEAYKKFNCFANANFSQKLGINASTPDASSILDIRSTSSGVLDPRMTDGQFSAIASKATALRAYTTDDDRVSVKTSGSVQKVAWLSDLGGAGTGLQLLGSLITPTINQASGVWASVIGTLNGTNIVAGNTMVDGSTITLEFTGTITPVNTGGTGQIRVLWGGAGGVVLATSQILNYSGLSGVYNTQLKFSVTMSGANVFNASVAGWAENSSNQMVPLQMYINPLNKVFDSTIANTIDVEYQPIYGALNLVDLQARNLTIIKHN